MGRSTDRYKKRKDFKARQVRETEVEKVFYNVIKSLIIMIMHIHKIHPILLYES